MFTFIQLTNVKKMHHLKRILEHFPNFKSGQDILLEIKNFVLPDPRELLTSIIKHTLLVPELYEEFRDAWKFHKRVCFIKMFEIAVGYGNLEWINFLLKLCPNMKANIYQVVFYKMECLANICEKFDHKYYYGDIKWWSSARILPKFADRFTTELERNTRGLTFFSYSHIYSYQFPQPRRTKSENMALLRAMDKIPRQCTIINQYDLVVFDLYALTEFLISENLEHSSVQNLAEKLGTICFFGRNLGRASNSAGLKHIAIQF